MFYFVNKNKTVFLSRYLSTKFSKYLFQLLLKPKFSCIEKIKTIGSTYMLASGLRPGQEDDSGVSSFKITQT